MTIRKRRTENVLTRERNEINKVFDYLKYCSIETLEDFYIILTNMMIDQDNTKDVDIQLIIAIRVRVFSKGLNAVLRSILCPTLKYNK